MNTLMKRTAVAAWVCAIVVFGLGTLTFKAAITMRGLTLPYPHEEVRGTGASDFNVVQVVRRPTLLETLNSIGIHHDYLALVTGASLAVAILGACIVPWWFLGSAFGDRTEASRSAQDLYRVATRLSGRVESLETVLLDRALNTGMESLNTIVLERGHERR